MGDDLVFVCGGLEPGVNGVGDHVARLAAALAGGGRSVSLLAYADPEVVAPRQESRSAGTRTIACLRLPAGEPGGRRLAAARAFLEQRAPRRVSLHYVNFAFQRRGLPWRENQRLAALLAGRRAHLMLHELWVGLDDAAPWRRRLLGALQRRLLGSFLARVRSMPLDTSIPVFQRELARLGHRAGRLPIFANLPPDPGTAAGWLERELAQSGLDPAALRFLSFGSIPEGYPAERVFGRIAGWAEAAGRPAALLCIGRSGPGLEALPAWRERHPALRFLVLGPQPAERIVDALQSADYGLSGFPLWVAGKSGTTAAMLEQGLPTVVGHLGRTDGETGPPADVADLVVRADLPDSRLPPPRREVAAPRRVDRLAQVVSRYEALLAEGGAGAAS